MRYALNLGHDHRILSVTFLKYASGEMVAVEEIPEDNILNYRYVEGRYVFDPISDEKMEETPTRLDALEAQAAYTAMMTDTLLGEV